MSIIIEDNLKMIKKYLKRITEDLGDKIEFKKITSTRINATITREDGKKEDVYWLRDEGNGSLKSPSYYKDNTH